MQTSTVKWFDAKKGYGFIEHPDDGEDIFVHYSNIESEDEFKTLESGQEVEFELNDGPKGLHALDVAVVGDTPAHTDEEHSDSEIGPADVDPTAEVDVSLPGDGSSDVEA